MNSIYFPILKTERLTLRAFTLEDAKDVQRLAGDKLIADTTLLISHPYPDGEAEIWIGTHNELFLKGTDYIFAITKKENEELIGAIGLNVDVGTKIGELGYWIGVPFWNKGYCTEAVKALLKFGFNELKLHKIHAHHFINNTSSGRVLLKSGMKLEGVLKQHIMKDDNYIDIKTYGILKSEFDQPDLTDTDADKNLFA
jgi:RimJ/RimL family protein N-acetyltransferase